MAFFARVLVFGVVQDVGYRGLVRRAAAKTGVKGLVRNQSDGSVEVFAEARDELHFHRFLDEINVHLGAPSVDKIVVFKEGDAEFRPAWRAYQGFEVDLGD